MKASIHLVLAMAEAEVASGLAAVDKLVAHGVAEVLLQEHEAVES